MPSKNKKFLKHSRWIAKIKFYKVKTHLLVFTTFISHGGLENVTTKEIDNVISKNSTNFNFGG